MEGIEQDSQDDESESDPFKSGTRDELYAFMD